MKNFIATILFFLAFLQSLLIGCSGKGTPLTPMDSSPKADISESVNYDPSDFFPAGILGIFTGYIDPINLSGELVPLRKSLSQDVLEVVDITNFLSLAPCTDCVKIRSVYLNNDGDVTADIGIRHPFRPGDPLKPPTGKNRLDLHVFNIEGIVVMKSGSSNSFAGLGVSADKAYLKNASGYTKYLDQALDTIFPTDANIHPYILHFKDYSTGNFDPLNPNGFADLQNPRGYLVMPMGSTEDIRPYVFKLSEYSPIEFILAVGCTYGISADNKSQRLNPKYRLPQFNKKAASEVYVEIFENNLHPNMPSSSATLHVKVLDMNHGIGVGDGLGDLRAESNVAIISVEVPGVTSAPVVISNPIAIGGDPRDPSNPLKYIVSFQNSASAGDGSYTGVVKITDSYPVVQNESPLLAGKDGIKRVSPYENPLTGIFAIDEFATYQTFTIDIYGNMPPVADLDVSSNTVESGCTVDLYPGPGTYDPDGGSIVLYEYDFDYDGINFTVDASNTTGNAVKARFYNHGSTNISVKVAIRVWDDDDPQMWGIDSQTITVEPFSLGINFYNNPVELPMGWWYHGTNFDPALCLEDDNQICCVAIQWDYAGAGSHNDCKSACLSNNGLTWFHSGTSIGTGARLNAPIKVAADKGDTVDFDSYCYFGWYEPPTWYPTQGNFICKNSYPYEYAWFNVPFEHGNEIYGSAASGYIYAFGDCNNRIERRRGTTPHIVQNSWELLPITVSDADPRLSWVRSIDENPSGNMFLAYFNSNGNTIKYIKSTDTLGDNWIEGTIWSDPSGTYDKVQHPSVDIDSDGNIHVSFLRRVVSTNQYQICYTFSDNGGSTFIQPVVAVSSSYVLKSTPVIYRKYGCHDVIGIVYEENGDIKFALSWYGGAEFISGLVVSNMPEPENNPDVIFDQNGDIIFAWDVTDATYGGSVYSRKAYLVEQ